MCWLESVIRKMRSHYFASGNWNNCFEWKQISVFCSLRSVPTSIDLSRSHLSSYVSFFCAHISFRFAYIAWMGGDRVRLRNDRHDRRVLYSLFTHCLHTFRDESRPLKNSICGQDVITVNCARLALCVWVCCLLAAMFVFSGTESIFFSSSTFQVSRIFASFVWNRVEKIIVSLFFFSSFWRCINKLQ